MGCLDLRKDERPTPAAEKTFDRAVYAFDEFTDRHEGGGVRTAVALRTGEREGAQTLAQVRLNG